MLGLYCRGLKRRFLHLGLNRPFLEKRLQRSPIWQKNLNEKPNIARILYYEMFDIEKKQNQKNIKSKGMQNVKVCHPPRKAGTIK